MKAKQRYNCYARLTTSMCIKWSRYRLPELPVACGIANLCSLEAVCSLSSESLACILLTLKLSFLCYYGHASSHAELLYKESVQFTYMICMLGYGCEKLGCVVLACLYCFTVDCSLLCSTASTYFKLGPVSNTAS